MDSYSMGITLRIPRAVYSTPSGVFCVSHILVSMSTVYLTSYQAIAQFILLADESDLVPDLSKHRSYADYHLSRRDWEHLEHIKDALRVRFHIFTSSPCSHCRLGAVEGPANVLESACSYSLADHTKLRVSHRTMANDGCAPPPSKTEGRAQRRHQEPP
jgi:hypothetical protein